MNIDTLLKCKPGDVVEWRYIRGSNQLLEKETWLLTTSPEYFVDVYNNKMIKFEAHYIHVYYNNIYIFKASLGESQITLSPRDLPKIKKAPKVYWSQTKHNLVKEIFSTKKELKLEIN